MEEATDASTNRPGLALRAWGSVVRHRLWWLLLGLPFVIALAAATVTGLWVWSLVPQTPTIDNLKNAQAELPSVLVTSDGQVLSQFRKAHREWVKLGDISPHVVDALLATEDLRFYQHRGLDVRRTVGAAINTFRGRLQGGSTLTQQLARNLYPEEIGRAPTLERKVKEAITALKIEQAYSKDDILEIYLNTVPFLYNTYGIELAARTYFDRPARELDVLQSATLVGMLKGTTYYNPVLNPARAKHRRNTVLAQLKRAGKLEAEEYAALRHQPLQLDFERQDEQLGPAPHYAVLLRRWLIDWADRNGYNVYADGLTVRTTLDSRAQNMATEAMARQMERLQKLADTAFNGRNGWQAKRDLVDAFLRESAAFQQARRAGKPEAEVLAHLRGDAEFMKVLREEKTRLQSGFFAMEPATGYVRAWVGSRDFALDQYDHVQQARRQPGSTFKPFVYGAAFSMGARPSDQLPDQAVEIQDDRGQMWRPRDPGEPTGEPVSLRDGLAHSRNRITAQLMQYVGPDQVAALARSLGVRDSRLDEVPSLGLGTSPVTLKEMVTAYAAIANGGRYVPPLLVLDVRDRNGKVLEQFHPPEGEAALDAPIDAVLLDAMRGVLDRGTGTAIRTKHGLQGDLAGKTGTTQDNTDGWFILMHPQLVAGAWVGFNDSRLTMQDAWGQGARSALPMVGDFFQQVMKAKLVDAKARFPKPEEAGWDEAALNWGTLIPPPQQPLIPLEVVAEPARPAVIEQAVVVAPPRSAAPEAGALPPLRPLEPAAPYAGMPVERAVVVAPPRSVESTALGRNTSIGEASGGPPASANPPLPGALGGSRGAY
ncbi:penicillin-binding protein 1A [Ramlibacter humi]|uniref:Penicillin-binding protein n=1 Tax=Ramlibacter humi TaxID=2530451 RepID=A0A4Z0BGF4_9BURK|nr:transglycosylase domain-containing protein [Ramlibacter humi]TFY98395.1 penicillin-binding protein [Ramlibacter humi]